MGIKISEMEPLYFVNGGTEDRIEMLEIAEYDDGRYLTKSVTSESVAALSAPFRHTISTNQFMVINDAGSIEFELGRIYTTDLVREQIRYRLFPVYDPTDPYSFPYMTWVSGGVMHINLFMRLRIANSDTKFVSITADGVCDNNMWSFSGINSKTGPIEFAAIPRPEPTPDSYDIWPVGVRFEDDNNGKGPYLSIYTTINFTESATAEFITFGYIDTVLDFSNPDY